MSSRYTDFFERYGFPILDRFNGTSIARKLDFLRASERNTPAEIFSGQEEKLERLLQFVGRDSGFYRKFWEARKGSGPRSAYSELDGLPVVKKSDLWAARDAFPLPSYRGSVIESRTSGSTGHPMVFLRSPEQESWFWALRFRIWRWSGYRPGDPYLTINLNPRKDLKKQLQDQLFRCAYMTFNADNQDSAKIVKALQDGPIPFLNGFSSSLYVLARYLIESGTRVPDLRGITSTGDTLFPSYRETIEQAFETPVLDYYGAGGEGVHLASQCMDSRGKYHIHPENAILEILTDKGPVHPGERGRLVVTQLDNLAMPLIRYQLDDVAVAASEEDRCACGRTLPMLEKIEGRIPDLVALPDGTFLVMHFFVVLFKNLQAVHQYQIVQQAVDGVLVRLVGRVGAPRDSIEKEVREKIRSASRGLLEVEFEWIDEIPLSGAGKRRLVISSVTHRLLGRSDDDGAEQSP